MQDFRWLQGTWDINNDPLPEPRGVLGGVYRTVEMPGDTKCDVFCGLWRNNGGAVECYLIGKCEAGYSAVSGVATRAEWVVH